MRGERHGRRWGGLRVVGAHVPVSGAGGGEQAAADAAARVASVTVQVVGERVPARVGLAADGAPVRPLRCRERDVHGHGVSADTDTG